MGCNLSDIEKFKRGVKMYHGVVDLVINYNERGTDTREVITDRNFLKIFGAKVYDELPGEVRDFTNAVWNMKPEQLTILRDDLETVLVLDSDNPKQDYIEALRKSRKNLAQATPLRNRNQQTTVPELLEDTHPLQRTEQINFLAGAIANGLTEDEIVDQVAALAGGVQDENQLRDTIRQGIQEYRDLQKAVREVSESTKDPSRFIERFANSRFKNSPAWRKFLDNLYDRPTYSTADAKERAADILKSGYDFALTYLRKETARNTPFVPVLAGSILENAKVRKDHQVIGEVLDIMNDFKSQAGLSLQQVNMFYQILGLATAEGKINFFTRVKNRMFQEMVKRMERAARYNDEIGEVVGLQEQVFSKVRSADMKARLEKFIKNLKC